MIMRSLKESENRPLSAEPNYDCEPEPECEARETLRTFRYM